MLNVPKSDGDTARLSVAMNPWNQRRTYPTSTDTRGSTSCCTEKPTDQSDGRTPQPLRMAGSIVLEYTFLPKFRFESAPQTSPPVRCRSCASGLVRSQSGAKLPLLSVQLRVTLCAMREVGLAMP